MSLKTAFTEHLFHLVIQPLGGDSSSNKREAEGFGVLTSLPQKQTSGCQQVQQEQ